MRLLALSASRLLDPTLLLLIGLGIALWFGARPSSCAGRRSARIGARAAWGIWAAGWLLSSPWSSVLLMRAIEAPPTDVAAALAGTPVARRALVVLAGGMRPAAHGAPPIERLGPASAARAIGAARIYREHGFGVVVVSGAANEGPPAEMAEGMAELMVKQGVPRERILLETASTDTKENAQRSLAALEGRQVDRVVVVTSAVHMRRSVWEFRRAGRDVIPAPVDYGATISVEVAALLPSSTSLLRSHAAIHEVLGRLKP